MISGTCFAHYRLETLYLGADMPSTSELSLINVDWPGSLLKCNRELHCMKKGDTLNIILNDPEIARPLMLVINRAENLNAEINERKGHILISVDKRE